MRIPARKNYSSVMDVKTGDMYRFVDDSSHQPISEFMLVLSAKRGYTRNSIVRLSGDGLVSRCTYHADEASHYHLVEIIHG